MGCNIPKPSDPTDEVHIKDATPTEQPEPVTPTEQPEPVTPLPTLLEPEADPCTKYKREKGCTNSVARGAGCAWNANTNTCSLEETSQDGRRTRPRPFDPVSEDPAPSVCIGLNRRKCGKKD